MTRPPAGAVTWLSTPPDGLADAAAPPRHLVLRPTTTDDLPALHALHRDLAAYVAATPELVAVDDRVGFERAWHRLLADPEVWCSTVLRRRHPGDDEPTLVGHVRSHPHGDGRRMVGAVARPWWGRGVGTAAVGRFLQMEFRRPVRAGVATHDEAALRVLRRHGFALVGLDRVLDPVRGRLVDEHRLVLR